MEKCVYHNEELASHGECNLCEAEVKECKAGMSCTCHGMNECKC